MNFDILSSVLTMVRLSGALAFRVDFRGPWGIAGDPRLDKFASALPPGTNHTIALHVVLAGECWVRHQSRDWFPVSRGHAVVFAHGDRHELADRRGRPVAPLAALLGGRTLLDLRHERFETGAGPDISILCGYLGCNRRAFDPLCSALPALFTVGLDDRAEALLQYAANQALVDCPGADSLRVRLAELLFVEILRLYMQSLPEDATGWLAGLRDPLVGRALSLLHQAPAANWSVERLAEESGSSRSNLASRFREVIGEPPMHYLARMRMQLAARYLDEHGCSVATAAEEVGYDSCAAFQRAFKRNLGVSPAAWRSRH